MKHNESKLVEFVQNHETDNKDAEGLIAINNFQKTVFHLQVYRVPQRNLWPQRVPL